MVIRKATITSQFHFESDPTQPGHDLPTHPTQPDHHLGCPDLVAEGIRIEREHIRHPWDRREGVVHYVGLGRVSETSTDTSTVRLRVGMNYG